MTTQLITRGETIPAPGPIDRIQWRIELIARSAEEIEEILEQIPVDGEIDADSMQHLSKTIETLAKRFRGGAREESRSDEILLRYLHWLEWNVERASDRAARSKGTIWQVPARYELETFVAAHDQFVSMIRDNV